MPTLEIRVVGPLLVAGDASLLGADLATARRLDEEGRSIPYIPATALRGAVRLQLEALLRGAGAEAAGPYPFDEAPDAQPADLVAGLFGFSGPRGERETYRGEGRPGAREGRLRFGDALPANKEKAAAAIRVRPGLELDDLTGSAADRKLFFREMAEIGCDLVFHAPLELYDVQPNEESCLRAAVEATDALGAGKAKGGGAIEIRWLPDQTSSSTVVCGEGAGAGRARLSITLLEPCHFGDGGALGNHHGTRGYIPGATIRGALAWALLRSRLVEAESEEFQRLFVAPEPASFGDGLAVKESEEEAWIAPATYRQERGSEATGDVLAAELSRARVDRRLAESGSPLALRSDDGPRRFDPAPTARPDAGALRRTRTRVSIDRRTAAAADGKLFSIEQIEPGTTDGVPARFVAWIEGIPPGGGELLAKIEDLPISFGAGRNHGLGRARVELRFEKAEEEPVASIESKIRALSSAVDREAVELARRACLENSVDLDPAAIGKDRLVLALVAQSDYVPTFAKAPHPLAELSLSPPLDGLAPVRRFLLAGSAGGFDERPSRNGPLKELLPAIGAGSVFVYEISPAVLSCLPQVMATLRRGVGHRTESGCGRFALHSRRDQPSRGKKGATEMKTGLSASELVKRAEEVLALAQENEKKEKAKPRWDQKPVKFWDQTSQLRNLLQITQSENEVPVLRNFIRYQEGRKSTREFWLLAADGVIATLVDIEAATAGDEPARARAIRNFLGYLVRHYVYLNETQKPKKSQEHRDERRKP